MNKKARLLERSWAEILSEEFTKPYMIVLKNFLDKERAAYKIFPKQEEVFSAFKLTPFNKVKVVILGQDPYHGFNQAHGLAFSVQDGVKIPPSLRNIHRELLADVGVPLPANGNLSKWAHNGVLLLNTTLTVREGCPASHSKKGWEMFTDTVIQKLSSERNGLVFMLWGNHAQSKEPLIDFTKHLVLKTSHPSPFSANRGFLGCKHFSQANNFLANPIDWSL
jgi:uracil-DNA glycosylase